MLEYSSTVTNAADTAPNVEGGWSGILDTYTGEMCILDTESVGADCRGF